MQRRSAGYLIIPPRQPPSVYSPSIAAALFTRQSSSRNQSSLSFRPSIAIRNPSGIRSFTRVSSMATAADHKPLKKQPKVPADPRPSSSVLLISPTNQILLLQRVRTSSSFASAHVFPGGALSPEHDGAVPAIDDPGRHQDGPAYRMAAIRETFEECGILLARNKQSGKLFSSSDILDEEREQGRRDVHSGKIMFPDLLAQWGVEADTQGLRPFTRWITPPNVPKRFSTQMYLYFLPIGSISPTKKRSPSSKAPPSTTLDDEEPDIIIPHPTHDGGIEHTAARFLPPNKWISLARRNRIILFPPQFMLTALLAPYLSATVTSSKSSTPSAQALQDERDKAIAFLDRPRMYNGTPEVNFTEACISPIAMGRGLYGEKDQDGVSESGVSKDTAVLALDRPGREVEAQGLGRRGILEWVVTTKFKKEGPRDVELRRRDEILSRNKTAAATKL
ncbi:unnamed protein product [Periconia digitata]|uniref:Nudix hydrolase domain-containing protein n=1 Tax=Periconia digitata TaxID=1303443 RepID=A0A9W4UEB5_9PLEO|nr:unnamed protein product [Periconia digitata]